MSAKPKNNELTPVTEPDHNPAPPPQRTSSLKTWPDFVRWLLTTKKGICALLGGITIALLAVKGLQSVGYRVQLTTPYIIPSVESTQRGELEAAITEGLKKQKPYIIESLTMLIRIDDQPASGGKPASRHMSERIVYTLRPLTDIAAATMETFREHYDHVEAENVRRWPGTEREIESEPAEKKPRVYRRYEVQFDATKGTTHTLVTGAESEFVLPMSPRSTHGLELKAEEDAGFYSNVDDDIICELTIIVESTGVELMPITARKRTAGTSGLTGTSEVAPARQAPRGSVISHKWTGIRPGDKVALVFSWK